MEGSCSRPPRLSLLPSLEHPLACAPAVLLAGSAELGVLSQVGPRAGEPGPPVYTLIKSMAYCLHPSLAPPRSEAAASLWPGGPGPPHPDLEAGYQRAHVLRSWHLGSVPTAEATSTLKSQPRIPPSPICLFPQQQMPLTYCTLCDRYLCAYARYLLPG